MVDNQIMTENNINLTAKKRLTFFKNDLNSFKTLTVTNVKAL